MAASADLQIVLRAIDHASPALRNAATAAQNLGTSARNAGPGFASMASAVAAGTVAANAFISAARGLIGVFSQAGSAAADFDQSIASMRSKLSTAEWDQYGEALQKTALRLGKDYPLSAGEAGKAIDLLVQKGVSAKAINEGWAESVVRLSSATGSDLVTAAGIAAAASDAFGISADRSGEVVNRITGAVIRGGMSITDFGFGFQASSAAVALAGGTIDDVTLGLAALARRGIEGSDAGTSLKTMYMNLIPTTKAAKETMAELGLTTADGTNRFFDATGKAKSFEEISKILATATKDLTQQQKLMALETIFGSDAIRAAAIAADLGAGEISELAGAIKSVDAGEVAKKRMDSLKGSITQFTGSAETLGIVLMGRLAPGFRTIIDTGTELLNDVLEMLETFEAAAFFEELARASQDFGSDLYAAGQSVSEFGASIADVPIIGAPLNAFFQTLGSVLTGFAALMRGDATGAADAFSAALGTLLDAITPIGGVISGVVTWVQELGVTISEAFRRAGEMGAWEAFVRGLASAATEIEQAKSRLDELGLALGDLDNAVGNGRTVITLLATGIRGVAAAFELWVLGIGQAVDGLLYWFTSMAQGVTVLAEFGRAMAALASGDMDEYHRAMTNAVLTLDDLKQTHADFASRTLDRVREAFGAVADAATDGYAGVAGAATDGMGQAEAATADGMTAVDAAVADGMAGAVGATDAGMAGVVASTDAGMAGMVASADAGAAGAVDAIAGAADPAAAAGAAFGEAATAGVTDGTVGMSDAANSAAADTVGAVEGYTGAAYGAGSGLGSNLGSGVFDGIMSWLGQVAAAARSLVNAAIGAGNTEAEVESPSKRTRRTGEMMAKGYIEGLESLAPEMRTKVEDFISASADYVPTANEIKRVEQEIKAIREQSQEDALFRGEQMIAVESEMVSLKRDQITAERSLLPLRQDLARATRDIADIERGSLGDRTQLIEMDGQRAAIRLQEIELEKQLIGLDRDSKKREAIEKQLDALRDQDRLLNLEADRIRTTNELAAVGTRVRREGLDDQVRAQERAIDAIKEQLALLDAEADVFQANERVIKNATDNEIDYRNRLIAVFRAEGKPLEDRVRAGLRLIDELEKEGKISKETATQLKKIGDEALKGKAPVGALGAALDGAGRESAAASRDMAALAAAEAEAARQAGIAKGSTDSYKASLVGLDAVDPTVTVTAPALAGVQGQVDTLKTNLLGLGATVTIPVSAAQIQTASNETALLDSRLDAVESDATVPTVNASQIVLARAEATTLDGRLDAIESDATTVALDDTAIETASAQAQTLDQRLDAVESDPTTAVVNAGQVEAAADLVGDLDTTLDAVEGDPTTAVVNAGQIQTASTLAGALDATLDAVEGDATVPTVSAAQIQAASAQAQALDATLDTVERDPTTLGVEAAALEAARQLSGALSTSLGAIESDQTVVPVNYTQVELARIHAQTLDRELDIVEQDGTVVPVNYTQVELARIQTQNLDRELDIVEQDGTVTPVNYTQVELARIQAQNLDSELDQVGDPHTLVLNSQIPQAVTVATLKANDTDLNNINNVSVGGNIETQGGNIETEGGDVAATTGDIETVRGDVTGPSIDFPDVNQMIVNSFSTTGRALGGPVGRGIPYMVGELGPELFVPDMGGSILPASETAALMSGAFAPYAVGGAAVVGAAAAGGPSIQIILQGNTILGDDRKVIQELARRLQPELSRRVGVGS